MYENQTFELILQRMLNRIRNNVDKREGSVIYDANASAAVELQLLYIALNDIMNEAFADTASREFLIRRAKERGITPFPATHAILQGEFTPVDLDVTDRRFSMPNTPLTYVVVAALEENGQVLPGVYRVRCEQPGSEGNRFRGPIIPILHIPGLQTAELTSLLIPAQDDESTEALRRRFFDSFKAFSFGGNIQDYIDKTNAIDGVGATKVTPVWSGGGTVRLTILDSLFNAASPALIDTVQEVIDPQPQQTGLGIAPIGHLVTVTAPTVVPINISTSLILDNVSWQSVEFLVIAALENYLLELRNEWAGEDHVIIYRSQIDARILAVSGVIDVAGTLINGQDITELALGRYEIPVFGGITV